MTTSFWRWSWKLGRWSWLVMGGAIPFGIASLHASLGDCANAQITPDTTLGSENSTITSRGAVDEMNGGATRGTNLFHSFQEFNVNSGRSVLFTNPTGISNILSRVTGANPSNILGTLGVCCGNANLFLINPNGIIFGPSARLDVGGSFVATTANAIGLTSGDIFSANPGEPLPNQLLNVNPNAFLFNQIAAARSIINRSTAAGTGLEVPQGRSLLLMGGDVRLEDGQLQALGGRVELGGLAVPGSVGLSLNGSLLSLSFPDDVQRTNVYLINNGSNTAGVNVTAFNGGSIAITAGNIDISGGSVLRGGLETDLGFPGAQAGDIELSVQGAIKVANSFIANNVRTGSVGKAGNIDITAGSLSVTNGAQLNASTYGQGDAGSVIINARDTVSFDGMGSDGTFSGAGSNVGPGAVGKGGGINIQTGSLAVTNGAVLVTSTFEQGDAGSVTINARDTVSFDGGIGAGSTVEAGAVGTSLSTGWKPTAERICYHWSRRLAT